MPAPSASTPAAPGAGCPSQEELNRTGSAGIPPALESQHRLWCRRWISQALKVASFSHFKPLSTSTASRHCLTQCTAEIIARAVGLTVPPHVRGDEIPLSHPTRSGALGYASEMGDSQFISQTFTGDIPPPVPDHLCGSTAAIQQASKADPHRWEMKRPRSCRNPTRLNPTDISGSRECSLAAGWAHPRCVLKCQECECEPAGARGAFLG